MGNLLALARKHVSAYQTSGVTCRVVQEPSLSDDVIRLRKSAQEKYCLKVLLTPQMTAKLDAISKGCKDPSQSLAPIFIPTILPGPTSEIIGNYFLEEDPWSKYSQTNERLEEDDQNMVGEEFRAQNGSSVLNIFLVLEPHHLQTVQATMEGLRRPSMKNVNLMYVVLPLHREDEELVSRGQLLKALQSASDFHCTGLLTTIFSLCINLTETAAGGTSAQSPGDFCLDSECFKPV